MLVLLGRKRLPEKPTALSSADDCRCVALTADSGPFGKYCTQVTNINEGNPNAMGATGVFESFPRGGICFNNSIKAKDQIMHFFNLKDRYHRWKVGALATVGVAASLALALPAPASAFEKAMLDSPAATQQAVEFDIYLPLRDRAGVEELLTQLHDPASASYHQWLTTAQFNERFGPKASVLNAISRELKARGLEVTETHLNSLHVAGTVGAVKTAFGAAL